MVRIRGGARASVRVSLIFRGAFVLISQCMYCSRVDQIAIFRNGQSSTIIIRLEDISLGPAFLPSR